VKNVLVVAAEDFEFAGILRRARNAIRPGWDVRFSRIAELNGMRLLLAANGPGPRLAGLAADAVKNQEQFESVVSTGICGALDPGLTIGEILVASQVNDWEAMPPVTKARYRSGRLVSVDRVAGTVAEKRRLYATGAVAVEMEAAAVAGRAREWRLPFSCIRAVSDAADEEFTLDLNEMRDEDGRFSKTRIVVRALKSPFRMFPELLRLNRNSGRAAKALGDFFADCSF